MLIGQLKLDLFFRIWILKEITELDLFYLLINQAWINYFLKTCLIGLNLILAKAYSLAGRNVFELSLLVC